MSQLLSQGGFGCVYYPGLDCKGKSLFKKNIVSKLQKKNFNSNNEIYIGKLIKTIPFSVSKNNDWSSRIVSSKMFPFKSIIFLNPLQFYSSYFLAIWPVVHKPGITSDGFMWVLKLTPNNSSLFLLSKI